mgnify:CR=1 FL=1
MRNLITFVLASLFIVGCNSSHVIPDTSELVIEHGDEVMSVHAGTVGAVLTSVLLTSHSARTIEINGVPSNLYGVLSENLSDSLTDMRLVRESDGVELTARLQPGHDSIEELTFEEPITLAPGESLLLLLVADVPVGASNRVEIELGAPSAAGRSMFPAIAYADNGDWVSDELVQGNVAHRAHVLIGE